MLFGLDSRGKLQRALTPLGFTYFKITVYLCCQGVEGWETTDLQINITLAAGFYRLFSGLCADSLA